MAIAERTFQYPPLPRNAPRQTGSARGQAAKAGDCAGSFGDFEDFR